METVLLSEFFPSIRASQFFLIRSCSVLLWESRYEGISAVSRLSFSVQKMSSVFAFPNQATHSELF